MGKKEEQDTDMLPELVAAIKKFFSISDEEVLDAKVNESEELAHISELYQCKMAS